MHHSLILSAALLLAGAARADPNDWINPAYAQAAAKNPPVGTTKSIQSIIHAAVKSSKDGPWTIKNSTVFAPSGDKRDYFSWAPYHWPDCNWCNSSHVNNTSPSSSGMAPGPSAGSLPSDDSSNTDDSSSSDNTEMQRRVKREIIPNPEGPDASPATVLLGTVEDPLVDPSTAEWGSLPWWNDTRTDEGVENDIRAGHGVSAWQNIRRPMMMRRREEDDVKAEAPAASFSSWLSSFVSGFSESTAIPEGPVETASLGKRAPPAAAPPTSKPPPAAVTASRAAQAGADKGPKVSATQKPSSTSKGGPSCTPSTTYVAPTATYSVCKYVQRDGQVNPDVRTLNSSDYMGKVVQSSITNALSWVITRDTDYSRIASSYIDLFFSDNSTGMNPNLNYGQVVRGPPGNQYGSFMAVVDLRGITKVANAVQLLRQTNAPDWTLDRDRRMVAWARSYSNWLMTSPIGKKAATAANNHGTFFVNQLAALQILMGDYPAAKTTLTNFFTGIFKDQITASGEQPFEAIRTRPYHYRAFNLEALLVNAKLADQLGLNVWSSRTKYNATIQSAIDYTMRLNPGQEDVTEMVPHAMAAMAAYGDPKGVYLAWVKKVMPDYDSRVYWFYNQQGAFTSSPMSASSAGAGKSQQQQQQQAGGGGQAGTTKSAGGKRDLGDNAMEQEGETMMMMLKRTAGNDTSSDSSSPVAAGGAVHDEEEEGPQPISDWHSVTDFTWLAPPLNLAKRLANSATNFLSHGNKKNSTAATAGTVGGTSADLLHMREENGKFTDG